MEQNNNFNCNEEEIDLVDLIGVVLKRRKFIILFILIFTVLGSLLVAGREFKRATSIQQMSFKATDIFGAKKDTALATYVFMKKDTDMDKYKEFLGGLLFPGFINVPSFQIEKQENGFVNYLFEDKTSAQDFYSRYNSFVDSVTRMSVYARAMDPVSFGACRQYCSGKIPFGSELGTLFENKNDIRNCNAYYHYYSLLGGNIKYATGSNVDDSYYGYILGFLNDNTDSIRLKRSGDIDAKELIVENKKEINTRKIIKYSVLIFIVSIMLAFVLAFVLEFWLKNKTRLKTYWR